MIRNTIQKLLLDIKQYKKGEDSGFDLYCQLGFSKDIKWFLPEGATETINNITDIDGGNTNLNSEARRIYIFHSDSNGNDPYPTIGKLKREALFLDIVRNVWIEEALFLFAVKDGLDKHPHWKKLKKHFK